MRIHEGLKYNCDYCLKQFISKQKCQYHLSIHTGLYRFKCSECGQGFNDTREYEMHVKLGH